MDEALEMRLGELLLKLKSGNISVLSEIDKIIGKRLRAYANIYYLQKADVDDAVQSLLCKLCYAVKKYKESKHAYAWVIKVFKNSILSHIQKDNLEKSNLQLYAKEMALNANDDENYIANYLFLKDIMSKLDVREQELVEYVFILGMSYSETARIFHRPKSTIEYQIKKLKEKIKNMD